jgi:hypothetical protein
LWVNAADDSWFLYILCSFEEARLYDLIATRVPSWYFAWYGDGRPLAPPRAPPVAPPTAPVAPVPVHATPRLWLPQLSHGCAISDDAAAARTAQVVSSHEEWEADVPRLAAAVGGCLPSSGVTAFTVRVSRSQFEKRRAMRDPHNVGWIESNCAARSSACAMLTSAQRGRGACGTMDRMSSAASQMDRGRTN